MSEEPSVVQALSAVMSELRGIGKDDRSPEGYAFRGIEAVTRQLQPLLAQHGVVIVPKAELKDIKQSPAMKDGWQDVTMRVEWDIYGPAGDKITAVTNGIGRDRSDKGSNKAQTQAFKYLLLHLLCISDAKDDADSLTYEDGRSPDTESVTAEQVADFHEALNRLGDDQRAALKAWFVKHKVPKVEKSTREQASKAIVKARELLSNAPVPAEEPPGDETAEAAA